ncbi:MAG: sulfotransferase [Dokdonella sp.]|uniref:tetratricopeptide repeat-containing sulfotransferase family protein n=1 Tax=Dokdonella sp. TaxID=2291710 RepID=UPI003265DB40
MTSRLDGLSADVVQCVLAAAHALEGGRADHAQQALSGALAARPDHPEVQRLHAGILNLRGDHARALQSMRSALAQRPGDALYHNTFATILADAGNLDGAIAALRRACELQPDLAAAWYNLGILLTRCVRYAESADALRRAVALSPHHLQARAQLADLLRMSDRSDEAIVEYRKVLAERPWTGIAWWGLADIKSVAMNERDSVEIRAALADSRATEDDRIAMGFALAKVLDDLGRYGESLDALAQANAIARSRKTWDASAFDDAVEAIRNAFVPAPVGSRSGLGGELIFVVGQPRSGTTLAEQILASHSRVEGAGELTDLPSVIAEESRRRNAGFPHWVDAMRSDDWERLGHRYLQRTAYWRQGRAVSVDKLPNNWLYIAAIRAMLPQARIVVCRRDALETCLSCYRQYLAGNDYTRTFTDLAAYWRAFDRSVRGMLEQHPTHVHEHDYEALLADPEARIRALLSFCALPFEEACVNFHQTHRTVGSPSAMQVRQPLRRDTARAPRYGALLDPLRIELGRPRFGEPVA